jgi:hypothetical protein
MADSILTKDIQRMAEEMARGKFRDTGRMPEFGESMDSMTGVPLRTFIDRAQKGEFKQGLLDAARSIGTDPLKAPTTEQLTEKALPNSNPAMKTGLKTALDMADLTSLIPQGKALKGIGATIKTIPGGGKLVGKPLGGLGKPVVDDVVPFTPRYKSEVSTDKLKDLAEAEYAKKEQLISVQSRLDSLFKRATNDAANAGIDLKQHPKFPEIQELQALKEKLTKGQ